MNSLRWIALGLIVASFVFPLGSITIPLGEGKAMAVPFAYLLLLAGLGCGLVWFLLPRRKTEVQEPPRETGGPSA